ncbi:MAG: MBL fold metallo-hydrolase [Acidimicrobiia bacterium]|nr:MBL fold metallo-hydrolase [Acidimicrobiia bacterium]
MSGRTKNQEGLARLGQHTWAYLQPDWGFGLSNAGVVGCGGDALLVDTFFDLAHTRRLLEAVASQVGMPIRTLVNTHDNGDHCWGNQLVEGAEIIGHRLCADAMGNTAVLELLRAAQRGDLDALPAGRYLRGLAEPFDFDGIVPTPPSTVMEDTLTRDVGGVEVEARYVGPAHTAGDVIVTVPADGVVYAGDVIFRLCHPLEWQGTYANLIEAMRLIESLDVEHVVSGHGPLAGKEAATEMREYFEWLIGEARERWEAGISVIDAARAIDPGPYADWAEPERMVFGVDRAYREFEGKAWDAPFDAITLFDAMAAMAEGGESGAVVPDGSAAPGQS